MMRAAGVLLCLGIFAWAGPILVLIVRETCRRGMADAHAGQSWAPRDETL